MSLKTEPNLDDVDAIYERLLSMLEGQDDQSAMRTSARLILLLMNHIGDRTVIEEAISKASVPKEQTQ